MFVYLFPKISTIKFDYLLNQKKYQEKTMKIIRSKYENYKPYLEVFYIDFSLKHLCIDSVSSSQIKSLIELSKIDHESYKIVDYIITSINLNLPLLSFYENLKNKISSLNPNLKKIILKHILVFINTILTSLDNQIITAKGKIFILANFSIQIDIKTSTMQQILSNNANYILDLNIQQYIDIAKQREDIELTKYLLYLQCLVRNKITYNEYLENITNS